MRHKGEIAKLELVGVQRTGRRRPIAISIGIPYAIRDGRGANCAACPVSIRGLGRHSRLNARRTLGEDTFQALSIALAFVRRWLLDFVESGNRVLSRTDNTRYQSRHISRDTNGTLTQALLLPAAARPRGASLLVCVAAAAGKRRLRNRSREVRA